MPSGICIFCGEHTTLTREHVFSEPILGKLIGVNGDVGLSWTDDGSRELWAGAVGGKTPHDLTIDCVCSGCNNEWLSRLDGQFVGDVKWWAENPAARLGSPRLDVITRYLLKLLFVVAVGERMAQPHWIVGEGPEPEFIPLTMRADGQAVLAHCLDDLKLNVHIGVCAVPKQTLDLITLIPVSADFIPETSKVSRTNSGLAVTFRRVGLRFYCLATWLSIERWTPRWPPKVQTLRMKTRSGRLPMNSTLDAGSLILRHSARGPTPEPVRFIEAILDDAQRQLRGS